MNVISRMENPGKTQGILMTHREVSYFPKSCLIRLALFEDNHNCLLLKKMMSKANFTLVSKLIINSFRHLFCNSL